MTAGTWNTCRWCMVVLIAGLAIVGCDVSDSDGTSDAMTNDSGVADTPTRTDPGVDVVSEDVPSAEDVAPADVAPPDVPSGDTPVTDVPVAPLEIAGQYTDSWGGTYQITSATWDQGTSGLYNIAEYDNDGNWLVAQNDATNTYNPGMWSRMDWTTNAGTLYYCQTAYAAETQQAAKDTPAADATDPETAGCGGFSWTALTPVAP